MSVVNLRPADNRRHFWQWDTGQYLIAEGLSIGAEIHFDMPGVDVPLKTLVECEDDVYVARVPDELLQHAGRFTVWAYVIEDDISGNRTIYSKSYAVEEREKPPSYAYSETEILDYRNLDARLKKVEESMSGGTVDESQVEKIVSDYLEKNPPAPGEPGEDGHTPVKGIDYFTEEEITQVAQQAAGLVTIDEVDPSTVIFPNGLQTTYPLGKVSLINGMGTLVEPGGTLVDFFNNFIDEKNPETTDPSVSLTFSQAKAYEVGTKVTPTYSATLNPGSYTYGPDTGITAKSWTVKDTKGVTKTTASGSFAELQVVDDISYKITATASYDAGATPVTNTGNPYTDGKIPAGSKSATSSAITGYRNTFYGTLTAKTAVSSSVIRGLAGKSGKALVNGNSFTVTVPVGALRVVIAYPATLRDITSIKDVNGLNAEISSGFSKSTVNVEGANSYTAKSYKVYIMDFANANDKANKYTVTI